MSGEQSVVGGEMKRTLVRTGVALAAVTVAFAGSLNGALAQADWPKQPVKIVDFQGVQ